MALIDIIEQQLMERGKFQANNPSLPPCEATVTLYDHETKLVDIEYIHPVQGNVIECIDVPVLSYQGIEFGSLKEGDKVLIIFSGGIQGTPIIVSKINSNEKLKNPAVSNGRMCP